jgi:hypothetical protein
MHLMHQHICHFTVFDHGNSQDNEGNEHTWQHRRVTLIKGVFLYQLVQNEHWDQELEVKLKHSPPFWTVVVQ